MKTIKFRAWNKKANGWYASPTVPFWWSIKDNESVTITTNDLSKDVVLMQYINLLDKNGVEIYEGDIYTHDNCVLKHVVHDNVSFLQHLGLMWQDKPQELVYENNVEIIGNLYENPELLY